MDEPREVLLDARGIDAGYGRARILSDVALSLRRGEVVALMGRNGAGKSTTLKALMGLIPLTAGSIAFLGEEVAGLPTHAIARMGLGYVPEDRRVFAGLSVMENLECGRQPPRPGVPTWTVERLFDIFPNLAEMRDRPGGRMSGGEQQMLTIARTLMGNPAVLLLDEPSEGLAPRIVDQMADTVLSLKAEGLTVLLCEQNLRFAALVADRAAIIEKGRIEYRGTMRALMADEEARRAYLTV